MRVGFGVVAACAALLGGVGARGAPLVVDDADGVLARSGSPVCAAVTLAADQVRAAEEGRLAVVERGAMGASPLPAQFVPVGARGRTGRLWWLMPAGPAGRRSFDVRVSRSAPTERVRAETDAATGQVMVREGGRPVLRYNYRTVEPGKVAARVTPENRIYARARSDYIHPLYGPGGEELTKDWSLDHPHHRGFYWAWPEVDWHGERGDLHALQRVFARPTGQLALSSGPVFAQVMAENRWMWDDRTPIVREVATIRAYRGGPTGRYVDLAFRFEAIADDVLLARRGTEHYGGLNVRLAAIRDQQIVWHTDPAGARPRMAWETMQGGFGEAGRPLAVSVFQHPANPDYPGDWVKYPELDWSQPTFPTAKTRYTLSKGKPLVLRFRVWVRSGGVPADDSCAAAWKAYAAVIQGGD